MGSLAGAARQPDYNAGVLSYPQNGQKPYVEEKAIRVIDVSTFSTGSQRETVA